MSKTSGIQCQDESLETLAIWVSRNTKKSMVGSYYVQVVKPNGLKVGYTVKCTSGKQANEVHDYIIAELAKAQIDYRVEIWYYGEEGWED